MTSPNLRARHHVLGIVALGLFAALFTRLWYLQVLTTDDYELAARSNRTRTVITQAPRGRILDRNGNVLVENRRAIQVAVSYQDFIELDQPDQGELLRRLARELTDDAMLQHLGEREPNDPGPMPEAPAEGDDEGDQQASEEGDDEGDEQAAGEGDEPGEGEASVGEGEADEADPALPPAGVATGADNPDGQTEVEVEAPDPVTEEVLRERIDDPRFSKFKPIPVATGISEELEVYLRENPGLFPTVSVERVTVRDYRYGALLAHVLGYVGSITQDELDAFQNDDKPYENDDEIGKTGIERGMEEWLRGTPGQVVYEVDARNRPVGEPLSSTPAEPGSDVYLTIDINLQYLAEKGLAAEVDRRRGVRDNGCFVEACDPPGAAVVALDPRDGQVLAMASYPTYDPNLFIGGISTRDYQAITDPERVDEHHNPLINRAIGGQYAPGSTFKLFSAYAGLAAGQITPEDTYNDTGVYLFSDSCDIDVESNCWAQNAGRTAHGAVDLTRALTVSSDTYFYKLGHESWLRREQVGEEAMQEQMRLFGLGERTGVPLPGEAPGRIPDPTWLREFSDAINADDPEMAEQAGTWTAGTSANTMIGQGDVLVTPLQLANGYATLANGGAVWLPQFVLQVTDFASANVRELFGAEQTGEVPMPPEWRDPMIRGFDGVTKQGTGGTASSGFSGFDQSGCPVAGKTGTSQADDKNDSSLFTAFMPTPGDGRESTIAVAAVFEEAGFGGAAAVPLVRRLLEPIAASGCDLAALNADGSPHRAPVGGWFDVHDAVEEYTPPANVTQD